MNPALKANMKSANLDLEVGEWRDFERNCWEVWEPAIQKLYQLD